MDHGAKPTAQLGPCLIAGLLLLTLSTRGVHSIHSANNAKRVQERPLSLRRKPADEERTLAQRASTCPPGCLAHGVCNEELGRCDCLRLFTGPSCASVLPDIIKVCGELSILHKGGCRTDLPCFNNCNRMGKCDAGVCRCKPGYWGIDCTISWGPDGKPQLLGGRYKPRKTGVKIYIYELPFNISTWFSFARQDRPMQYLFWQRITSSGVRTLNGDEADYYFLPVFTRGTLGYENLMWALDYIRRVYPWWSRDLGHSHLVMHTGDFGVRDIAETYLSQHKDTIFNMTWLTHWGLSKWHRASGWKRAHRPGKDLVIPIIMGSPGYDSSPLNPANVAAAKAQGRDLDSERNGTFFFAGRICGDRSTPSAITGNCNSSYRQDYSLGVRQAVYLHHHDRSGYTVLTKSDRYLQDMATYKFCLAPVGGGYGKRQVLVSLMGCVPVLIGDGVMQPFQPEIDWSQFSISVPEADISNLHLILGRVTPEELAAKQKRLRCMAQHLFYSSSLGAILGDDGRYDAFEMVMEILRVRKEHPDVPPERYTEVDERYRKFVECDLDGGPDPLPLCTRTERRQFKGRLTCDQCIHREGINGTSSLKIPGGMLCCGDQDQAKCPRVWQ